jgi:hypothetical protein
MQPGHVPGRRLSASKVLRRSIAVAAVTAALGAAAATTDAHGATSIAGERF